MLKGPIRKLIDIAEQCIEELDAYSRYLGKKDTKRNDIEALLLLPDQIESKESLSLISNVQKICNNSLESNDGIISFKDFWENNRYSYSRKNK